MMVENEEKIYELRLSDFSPLKPCSYYRRARSLRDAYVNFGDYTDANRSMLNTLPRDLIVASYNAAVLAIAVTKGVELAGISIGYLF